MAHNRRDGMDSDTGMVLPLRFSAEIEQIDSAACLGEWIVGYPSLDVSKAYDLSGAPPEDWVSGLVNLPKPPRPEEVRRFLLREGTFREQDWYPVKDALVRKFPEEVKTEIRRAGLKEREQVYILRSGDFWLELSLLKSFMLIAGFCAQRGTSRAIKSEVQAAKAVRDELAKHVAERPSRTVRVEDLPEISDEEFERLQEEELRKTRPPAPVWMLKRLPQTDHLWRAPSGLIGDSFARALGNAEARFRARTEWEPGFEIKVGSILGIAYLTLLKSFRRRGWKRCQREDCGNLFPVTDDKRKMFCSQYCGHLESVRRKRKAERRQKKKQGGKR